MKFKKIILLLIFFTFSFIAKSNDKINDVDYMGFYLLNGDYYVKVGKYDEQEFKYKDIRNYILNLNNKTYTIVLLNKNNEINSYNIKELLQVSRDKKEKLENFLSFSYFPRKKTSYFFNGFFTGRVFTGTILVTFDEKKEYNNENYTILLLEGVFLVEKLTLGIDIENKNLPFYLNKSYGTNYSLKKYNCSIDKEFINVSNVESYELRSSFFPDDKSLAEIIELYR